MNLQAGALPDDSAAISLRPLTVDEIPFGLQLTRLAGWNQTETDWRMLLDQSAAGSYLAYFHGEKAGTVTTLTYPQGWGQIGAALTYPQGWGQIGAAPTRGQGCAAQPYPLTYPQGLNWVGMVLVAPEFRGRGIGTALMRAAIQAVQSRGTVCLDATAAGKPIYHALGFQVLYRLGRWLRPLASLEITPSVPCTRLSPEMLPAVAACDLPVFGADRSGILSALLRNTPSLAFYSGSTHEIAGYCLGRTGQNYVHIGPLVADRPETARDLLLSALQTCAHQAVVLDTTFHQPGWNQFLQDLGFGEQRPFFRMHLGEFTLPEQHTRQLAIGGPEIG